MWHHKFSYSMKRIRICICIFAISMSCLSACSLMRSAVLCSSLWHSGDTPTGPCSFYVVSPRVECRTPGGVSWQQNIGGEYTLYIPQPAVPAAFEAAQVTAGFLGCRKMLPDPVGQLFLIMFSISSEWLSEIIILTGVQWSHKSMFGYTVLLSLQCKIYW